jgi:hypothetical protein
MFVVTIALAISIWLVTREYLLGTFFLAVAIVCLLLG